MKGKLTLVPTPIDNHSPLEQTAFEELKKGLERGDIIAVEEAKTCRRRWIRWGLPREAVDGFELYNEHTREETAPKLLAALKKGKNVFMMSDCGLPAFCDPGKLLVGLCHEAGIKVTSTPYSNSVTLALALSGLDHERFIFEGFVPRRNPERSKVLKDALSRAETSIIMDTPYRLEKLLEEMKSIDSKREVFLAMDLNKEEEELIRGPLGSIKAPKDKKEFVLVIGPETKK